MRKIRLIAGVVIALFCVRGSAWADGCGTMLMPVVQLKQVARGFGPAGRIMHTGLDLTAPYGTPVRAALAGSVVFAGTFAGYGRMIDIDHGHGAITRYAHLSTFARDLRVGRLVGTGDIIGAVGTSGHAHGPHLHFEVRQSGRAVDPKPFLALAACPTTPAVAIEEARAPERPLRRFNGPQALALRERVWTEPAR